MRRMRIKEKTHGDFYKWFADRHKEEIKKLKNKWNPSGWNERYNYFTEDDWGWRDFVNTLPESLKGVVKSELFEFITKELNVEELLSEIQKTVNNYWNKIVVVKNIDENEERKFRELMNGIKLLSILSKHGTIRVSENNIGERLENIRAENFSIVEMPPKIEGINDKVIGTVAYITENECWWEIQILPLVNNSIFYFKANNPNKIPEMKCTIVDGVFMAIPSNLIDKALTARFTKLISDNSNGKKPLPKGKKRVSLDLLENMNMDELDKVVKDYKLDINPDDYDYEDDFDTYQGDIIRAMGENHYLTE